MKKRSLKWEIAIPLSAAIAVGIIIMSLVISNSNSKTTGTLSARYASSLAESCGNQFEGQLNPLAVVANSVLLQTVNSIALGDSRETLIDMSAHFLKSDPNIVGIGVCFEPNGYDGKDSDFKNAPGCDENGRLVAYTTLRGDTYRTVPLPDTDTADYYQMCKRSRAPEITDPFQYTINGRQENIISISLPIVIDDTFRGIAVIDFKIDPVVAFVRSIRLFETGNVSMASSRATIAAAPDESGMGKSIGEAFAPALQTAAETSIERNETVVIDYFDRAMGTDVTAYIAPVHFSLLDIKWASIARIPKRELAAPVVRGTLTVVICGVALLLVSVLLVVLMLGKRLKPLSRLAGFARSLAVGDLKSVGHIETKSNDEVGELMSAFSEIVSSAKEQSACLASLADGNLSAEVQPRCPDDVLGNAMKRMVDNLNTTVSDIILSTEHVSQGAKQLATGAEMLAHGSAEQAAAVEQLSASIDAVSKQTKENAGMATRAASLADAIKGNAEKGDAQMQEMLHAVGEITEASASINRVIKVIDDIAFQTNILALNAAVEAARAGQHGKGFAVVAEEVRNLAAKSAEAARDTGGLIADSIEKATFGARIAEETSTSLTEIVKGINQSSDIVKLIAASSEEQSCAISQINNGISQVAHVVQQNSANAEESASASHEISCEALVLEQLMGQFTLHHDSRPRLLGNR